jgi:hypothetical protein
VEAKQGADLCAGKPVRVTGRSDEEAPRPSSECKNATRLTQLALTQVVGPGLLAVLSGKYSLESLEKRQK